MAHLDLNPGNLVVTRGLPGRCRSLIWPTRCGLRTIPLYKDTTDAERAQLGTQWRMALMAQHLLRMWNIPSMRARDVFTEKLLPRIRELVQVEQDKCDALLARYLVPGQSPAQFYEVNLYE